MYIYIYCIYIHIHTYLYWVCLLEPMLSTHYIWVTHASRPRLVAQLRWCKMPNVLTGRSGECLFSVSNPSFLKIYCSHDKKGCLTVSGKIILAHTPHVYNPNHDLHLTKRILRQDITTTLLHNWFLTVIYCWFWKAQKNDVALLITANRDNRSE